MKKRTLMLALITSGAFAEGLKTHTSDTHLKIGAAVDMFQLLDNPDYTNILEKDFEILVAENAMKMAPSQPARNEFNFAQGDLLAAYAQKNNMKLRGHTLLWHEQVPKWMTDGNFSKDELEEIMKTHVQTVASHYKGKVFAWDVLNEAISDSGGLRDTLWRKTLGDDYIGRVFRYVREADPDAKLFYNDYNSETLNQKSNEIYQLVKKLKAEGVPIDGVGMQMHLNLAFPPSITEIQQNMKRLADLGLEVHITELDVRTGAFQGTPAERNAALAKLYRDITNVCLQAKNCTALITWGVSDNHSWLKGDSPLLYDGFYQPKPAYFAVQEALKGKGQQVAVQAPPSPQAATTFQSFATFPDGTEQTAQGADVIRMTYSEKPGDASIQSLTRSQGRLQLQYTLGKQAGSSFAGTGVIVRSATGSSTVDHTGKINLKIQLATAHEGTLRVRISGPDQNILNAGCYPVFVVKTTRTLTEYTLEIPKFTPESWCGANARSIDTVLPQVHSIEIADTDISQSARSTTLEVGNITLGQ
ncbi:endo-1,4-beta-xylanase [Deinococcus misasensis]|uniref:endo-1,4-beta-xylanase n=1 Tax=Deinococcus misasensis TaxID=392413 RepID=UPI000ADF1127|nr:endo-1,4-beta-xylanase [Deinococcus misasensis]